jgi:TorA maturation chaperone TorD/DNA-binding transcriptional regulator YdaS (Cro superfamily)
MTIPIQNKANTPPDGMEMREDGLQQAIQAAGGIGVLARALRVAQPAVSNWRKIPAERVLSVEAITGVARSMLRPDLYPMDEIAPAGDSAADEIDVLRAQEYDLLAVLLGRAPTREVLDRLSDLKGDASPLGLAHMALAEAAVKADPDALQREFFDLFIGIGRGELLPYASYYLTGFLHERPLASVRESLSALGIERADNIFEPEDHVAILCEVMAGLAARRFDAEPGAERRFFERHLRPWTPRFFADLETAQAARFYRAVARVGGLFMDIEAEAFAMDA